MPGEVDAVLTSSAADAGDTRRILPSSSARHELLALSKSWLSSSGPVIIIRKKDLKCLKIEINQC